MRPTDKKATSSPVESRQEHSERERRGSKKSSNKICTHFFYVLQLFEAKLVPRYSFFFFEGTDSAKVEKLVQHGKLTVRKVEREDEDRTGTFYTATLKLTEKKFL